MRQLESLQLRKQGRHHDSDAGIGFPLASLTALTCLCVARLKFGVDSVHMIASLPGLVQLDVSETQLDDAAAQGLAVLHKSLCSLDISTNRLAGSAGAGALTPLTRLTRLLLSHNALSCEGVQQLTVFTTLRSLEVRATGCANAGVCALQTLTGLTHLDLGRNAFGTGCVYALAAIRRVCHLDIAILDSRTLKPLAHLALVHNGHGHPSAL